jgi:outer membrane receptor protein involved in Fe transport
MAKDNFFFRDANGLNVTDGKTRHTGIELGVDWSLSPGLRLRGGISWSDQTYDFDREVGNGSEVIRRGNRIDTAPEWLGDVSLIWSPDDRFDAILSAEHVGDYQTNPANTRSYPGHTVLGLRGQYRMGEDLEVYVNLRNLLDERYADRADFAFGNDRYFPGEPRNLTVGVRRTFR